ncbi:BURP domain protein USPL1-like [Apium graveolens]|uniref:BURP domain protein USPL1-like n=1 Tax=Apium graveolens TaxID=4045 RepID=UPI003D79E34B
MMQFLIRLQQNSRNAHIVLKYLTCLSQLIQYLSEIENFEKEVSLKLISQVYHNINGKAKYDRASDSLLEKINYDNINLTLYHWYEDVNEVGKRVPLLFTNLGSPSAVLVKNIQPMFLDHSQILCGSAVSGEHAMIKFVIQHLGENIKPVSALPGKWQQCTITYMPKFLGQKMVGCHKTYYLQFAVYEYHSVPHSVARIVSLLGEDGVEVQAVTICHIDTSSCNPHYISFRILKAKPGIPVCHFLATDDIIWLPNSLPELISCAGNI